MSTLCTMPGRHGDILWALPTVRAIAEQDGAPVDLLISATYGSLAPLIVQQPYIRTCIPSPIWEVQETAPMSPRVPPAILWEHCGYDRVIHLGYDGWPGAPLPYDIARRAGVEIDLRRPWITAVPWTQVPHDVVIGFSDEWFELKYGVVELLERSPTMKGAGSAVILPAPDSRWMREGGCLAVEWVEAARRITVAKIFFGCCSALHVLAVALGIPCVIMEPAEARHHPIFWPLGTTGPEVTLVLGGDGKPTFDARHCAEALSARLKMTEKAGQSL